MVDRLAFLHTVESNIAPFDAAAVAAGFDVSCHQVRPDLLARATDEGGVSPALEDDVAAALNKGLAEADLVLLTCSSIGAVADKMHSSGQAVLRTDQILADAVLADAIASSKATSVAVLVVAPSSVDPTTALFKARQGVMKADNVPLDVILVPKVWDHFLAGDMDRYLARLNEAIASFPSDNPTYSHIALAQASMAKAADGVDSGQASLWTIPSATAAYLSSLTQD
ncbi:hypothetical protein FDK21_02110 [Cohaesibacter sp. CAU 1516]|uniref:hypothetical protein n=1 Tax=Cohaesibacter sp. CAU 1516 TaxID=2576038 RepID=UPI0010FD3F33|nr:hypothetical protein [Cohaesibacter sp. CAU 1516]TLP48476.1 hypothetical protein FDK21_02110 [Cohaesibacter sp. CAU 1516]